MAMYNSWQPHDIFDVFIRHLLPILPWADGYISGKMAARFNLQARPRKVVPGEFVSIGQILSSHLYTELCKQCCHLPCVRFCVSIFQAVSLSFNHLSQFCFIEAILKQKPHRLNSCLSLWVVCCIRPHGLLFGSEAFHLETNSI